MSSLSSLKMVIARCHRQLSNLFFRHQEAILVDDLPRAIESLENFTEAHDLHKDFEDQQLIPQLAKLDDPGGWPASLYGQEHDKIEALLSRLRTHLVRLNAQGLTGTERRAALIELLDREKSFKGLCEHHQEREETGMLPALDKYTDVSWRTAIIESFMAEWRATVTEDET